MQTRWIWRLRGLVRQLWVRALVFSVLGIATALLAVVAKPYIPIALSATIGANAVDDILTIVASSMLTVTTFTLSIMVAAFASAATGATPRATRLLVEDSTAQNVVATFLGAFLYALVGIVALRTGIYGDEGRVILFAATIFVIALIVLALLQWFHRLTHIGRVADTSARVEDATREAMKERCADPLFGCRPFDPTQPLPGHVMRVCGTSIGYVQHIEIGAIADITDDLEGDIYVLVQPGAFVDTTTPLAAATVPVDEDMRERIAACFTIDDERTYTQDPRFGLCVLAEIASRALSPAVNDAGTAIDITGRLVRLLSEWSRACAATQCEIKRARVLVAPLRAADLFDDAFTPIARDGAAMVEVCIRLQKALRSLSQLDGPDMRDVARLHSRWALARAEAGLTMEFDRQRVRDVAATIQAEPVVAPVVAAS